MVKNVFIRDDFRGITLIIEASLSEDHMQSVNITKHSVENGVDITDHIQPTPLSITMEVALGQTNPIKYYEGASETQLNAGLLGNNEWKPGKAWFTLLNILNGGNWDTPNSERIYNPNGLYIQTELCPYENMFLESISAKRDNNTNCILFATLKFTRLRTVGVKITNVQRPDILKEPVDNGEVSAINTPSKVVFSANAAALNNRDGEIGQLNITAGNRPEKDTIYRITTSDNKIVYAKVLAGKSTGQDISTVLQNPDNIPVVNSNIRETRDNLIRNNIR